MIDTVLNSTFIDEPDSCPSCNATLEKVKDQLFCRNLICPAQASKKVEHYCKIVGIKGLGPATIRKLRIDTVSELYYLLLEDLIEVIGEKLALKLQEEIEKSKTVPLHTFLAALSIPLVGETAASKLCKVITKISDINKDTCKQAGLGDKVTENLVTWLDTEGKEILPFFPFEPKVVKSEQIANLKTVCITGKLKSFKKKADAEAVLLAAGFKLVDSITKTTNYLVDEGNSQSTKRVAAEKYGIKIVTDLNDLIGKN